MPGSLTIVGLGPARAGHATAEATQVLRDAAKSGARCYGLSHVRALAAEIAPDLVVRPIDYLYALPGVSRAAAYEDLAKMMIRRAFSDGFDVVYLVAGSPLFINDAVLAIRHSCAKDAKPVRLVHGMSFVELVLERVFWTGHQGLQLLSAWNVARDGMTLAPHVPALLCQLGEFSAGGEAVGAHRSQEMLGELRDALLRSFPADHPVIILSSSGPPDYASLGCRISLSDLAQSPVPVYSNLWVPALGGPRVESELAPGDPSREDP